MTLEGHDPELLERVLPLVQFIEVTPDTIAESRRGVSRLHQPTLESLKGLRGKTEILVHGVGLSIGSHSGWSDAYLRLLDELFEHVTPAWHSEHLGYTLVDGEAIGTMLPVPRTDEALELICDRVEKIQARYPVPFLLEHIIHLIPEAPAQYSAAGFLNQICHRTGCGLILDLYNLECDAHNQGLDISSFLDELDLKQVREIHVACGAEHQGMLLDVHSRPTRESTLGWMTNVLERETASSIRAVVFELLREFVPILGTEGIVNELRRIGTRLNVPVA